jgi:hypothetical protein
VGTVPKAIAVEAFPQRTVNDAYAIGENVQFRYLQSGDKVQLVLKAGANAAVQGVLRVDNTGCVLASGTNDPVAHALQALDLTAEGAVDTLIEARLI